MRVSYEWIISKLTKRNCATCSLFGHAHFAGVTAVIQGGQRHCVMPISYAISSDVVRMHMN
jgi:hypothetical protein